MAQYTLATGTPTAVVQANVGTVYHLAMGNGTQTYGYVLVPESGGFKEKTDLHAKDTLVQYSSPNVIDRDFVNTPRVTQGDWSGGQQQVTFINPSQYFDSDLEINTAGYLKLRPRWIRLDSGATGSGIQLPPQVVNLGASAGMVVGTMNTYLTLTAGVAGTATSSTTTQMTLIETDGSFVYMGSTNNKTILRRDLVSFVQQTVCSNMNANPDNIWVIDQGTNGYFLYYVGATAAGTAAALYKIDLTAAFPVAPASQPQVPTGGIVAEIVDLAPYSTSIAILTTGVTAGGGQLGGSSDLWQHDGTNMTRLAHFEGYNAVGMCSVGGGLYIGLSPIGAFSGPILVQYQGGSLSVVARPNGPTPQAPPSAGMSCIQPRGAGNFVYWPITQPGMTGISANNYIIVYNTLTGAVSHLPNVDTLDFPNNITGASNSAIRVFAVVGESVVAGVRVDSTHASWQFQNNNNLVAGASIQYQASGKLVTSRFDFSTPSIVKQFRRLIAYHPPMPSGGSLKVDVFLDKDPVAYTSALTPDATVTNSTLNSTTTVIAFGPAQVARTIYYVLTLSTSTPANTPIVNYVSVEISVPWSWEFTVDCTNKRRTLAGAPDDQGVIGKDLRYLLRNAWENGSELTFTHPNGTNYTTAIESLEFSLPSPLFRNSAQSTADEESWVKVLLRQAS